jgi:hypothetical protein
MDLPAGAWAVMKDIGAAGLGVIALWLFYKIFTMFIEQWGKSTEAINRNTETHKEMQEVFQKSHEREIEFQKEVIILLKDTHKKVNILHSEFIDDDNRR